MTRHRVQAGQDVLLRYSERPALDALAELIWNALDAEASRVAVEYDTSSLVEGAEHVTRVRVQDDGIGFGIERAMDAFLAHGDSWKKALAGRTPNGVRALHGSQGRGRFFAYALGHAATWTTVSQADDGSRRMVRIRGTRRAADHFDIEDLGETEQPTGTTVEIRVEQGRSLSALLADDAHLKLAARLAPHLLGSPDLEVRVDGRRLDPGPLLAGTPTDYPLDLPPEVLGSHGAPVLRLIEWTDQLRESPPVLLLCNAGGAALFEVPARDVRNLRRPELHFTGYLMWDGFAEAGADFLTIEMKHPEVLDAAHAVYAERLEERARAVRRSIVEQLQSEGSYPFSEAPRSPVERAERDLYDVVLVAARPALRGTRQQRRLSARLLKIAVEERPEALDVILNEVLALPADVRDELAALLRRSPLSALVRLGAEVGRRIDLLTGLRRLLYGPDERKRVTEVRHLHPLVREAIWLFGDDWYLTRSELSLSSVIREVVDEETVLEEDLQIVRPDGRAGRVDLLLHRQYPDSGRFRRLVVELKRPTLRLGQPELAQIKGYAKALSEHPAVGPGRWEFWLVGSAIKPEIEDDLGQSYRDYGHVLQTDNYDVWVLAWGDLIDQALARYEFLREQLDYSVGQDDALDRLRERFGVLIPEPEPTIPRSAD